MSLFALSKKKKKININTRDYREFITIGNVIFQ